MSEKKRYEVTQPVSFNNKAYEVGKPIDLTDEDAQPLLAANGIKPSEEKKK